MKFSSLISLRLVHRGDLKKGETLLVTGAAGGMGMAAIQVGKVLNNNNNFE
jgi:NADPH:quinone reductase-like Zn-dependent oxidoreductase